MAKRRLNQQQLRRIDSNQQQRGKRVAQDSPSDTGAEAAPISATQSEPLAGQELGPEVPGLVICHYGQQLDIESHAEHNRGTVYRCHQRSNLPPLVTGDNVVWQAADDNSGVVVALQERRTILSRPNAHGDQRPVAANVDVMAIVIAPLPQPFGNLIDRYLVAAESLGLRAVILLNKTDLLDSTRDAFIEPLLELYKNIGYPVIRVSTKSNGGIEDLQQFLAQQTAVFVGQSGVGKSSLINSLRDTSRLPDDMPDLQEDAAVGELSAGRDKGTHTTTATRLYHLIGSGDLIDSPGIREFGLWHMDQHQLIAGFIEFKPFIDKCRFRDCRHLHEPGCALLDARDKGLINPERLTSYFHTLSTITPA